MRFLIAFFFSLLVRTAKADDPLLAKHVKASLVFEADHDPESIYPHLLKVFFRIENTSNGEVFWTTDGRGIEAELLDPEGKPAALSPAAMSIASGITSLRLPYGSRLDWLISHGGVTLAGDRESQYALIVGSRGWLIPMDRAEAYTLWIRLRGQQGDSSKPDGVAGAVPLLLDLPPTPIHLAK